MTSAFFLSTAPTQAQPAPNSNLNRSPSQQFRAPPRVSPPTKTTTTTTTGRYRTTTQSTTQTTKQSPGDRQSQPAYRYDTYNGYHVPVYPGPDAPLPPTGGYYDPYYSNGYYNNGYYNNGYYNNGYYNNGYSNTQTGTGSGFPPFERY